MKKLILTVLLVLSATLIFSLTHNVSDKNELLTAINSCNNGDIIILEDGIYEIDSPLNVDNEITIKSRSNSSKDCVIKQESINTDLLYITYNYSDFTVNLEGITLTIANNTNINNFLINTITAENTNLGRLIIDNCTLNSKEALINARYLSGFYVRNSSFLNSGTINIYKTSYSEFMYNHFEENFIQNPLFQFYNGTSFESKVNISKNDFKFIGSSEFNGVSIVKSNSNASLDFSRNLIILENVFNDNYLFEDLYKSIIMNNTFVNGANQSSGYVFENLGNNMIIKNNIMNNFEAIFNNATLAGAYATISHNNIYQSQLGINCSNLPNVIAEQNQTVSPQLTSNYHLNPSSLCINAASPDYDGDGIEYEYLDDTQKYGSLHEIGCYDEIETYDTKHLRESNYFLNWIGYPRLDCTDSQSLDLDEVLFQDSFDQFISTMHVDAYRGHINHSIYDDDYAYNSWMSGNGDVYKNTAIKLDLDGYGTIYEQRTYGNVIAPNTALEFQTGYNWVVFGIPAKVSFKELFGDYFDQIESVEADRWMYLPDNNNGTTPKLGGMKPICNYAKPFQYGKAYKVKVKSNFTLNSGWNYDVLKENVKTSYYPPTHYSYQPKAEYEAIDILDIPENVQEVAVYENGECLGAAKVDSTVAQVLVYSDRVNRNESPFSLEFFTGSRSVANVEYQTYDADLQVFTESPVLSGKQKHSIIRIKSEANSANKIIELDAGNIYPNPFNGSNSRTGISLSYNITKEAQVSASVYNIKGQKVAKVFSGNMDAGKHTISWNGTASNGNQVASGVYFMKVKAGNKEVLRKFVMMK